MKIIDSKLQGNVLQEFTADYLEKHKELIKYVKEETEKQLTLTDVGSSLPDLAECNQASLDYATKKDNPDFFLIKQTFKEGINWALNYMTKNK